MSIRGLELRGSSALAQQRARDAQQLPLPDAPVLARLHHARLQALALRAHHRLRAPGACELIPQHQRVLLADRLLHASSQERVKDGRSFCLIVHKLGSSTLQLQLKFTGQMFRLMLTEDPPPVPAAQWQLAACGVK